MPTHLDHDDQATQRMLDLIPVSSVCFGCHTVRTTFSDWRLSIFGDVICKWCLEQERILHADLYADPDNLHRRWQKLAAVNRESMQFSARRERRRHAKVEIDDEQAVSCITCARPYDGLRQFWVKTGDADDQWQCRSCYSFHYGIEPEQYREDKWFRIFKVTGSLRAAYPFGVQQMPQGSSITDACCETMFTLQQQRMHEVVAEHLPLIETEAARYSHNAACMLVQPIFTHDDAYDVSLYTAMKGATLDDNVHKFAPYLLVAIRQAVFKELRKRQNHRQRHGAEISISEDVTITDPDYLQRMEEVDGERRLLKAAELTIGPENWEVLRQWVLEGRSQEDIGVELGIIAQSVSARIKKAKTRCQPLVTIEDERQQWTLVELVGLLAGAIQKHP